MKKKKIIKKLYETRKKKEIRQLWIKRGTQIGRL